MAEEMNTKHYCKLVPEKSEDAVAPNLYDCICKLEKIDLRMTAFSELMSMMDTCANEGSATMDDFPNAIGALFSMSFDIAKELSQLYKNVLELKKAGKLC